MNDDLDIRLSRGGVSLPNHVGGPRPSGEGYDEVWSPPRQHLGVADWSGGPAMSAPVSRVQLYGDASSLGPEASEGVRPSRPAVDDNLEGSTTSIEIIQDLFQELPVHEVASPADKHPHVSTEQVMGPKPMGQLCLVHTYP